MREKFFITFTRVWVSVLITLFVFAPTREAKAQTCVQPPSGMVSWWPGGDGNANDIQDGNNGMFATFEAGIVGQAFSFDGVSAHIALGDIFDGLNTGFTLDAWIKTTSIVGNKAILAKYWTTGSSWVIRTNESDPSKVDFTVCRPDCQSSSELVQLLSTSSINDGMWHFIAATFDGTTQRLYIDGNLEASGINTNPAWTDSHHFCIGAFCDFNGNAFLAFDGLIDEPEIFNRALTAEEIQAIYNAGSAGKCREKIAIDAGHGRNRSTGVPQQPPSPTLGLYEDDIALDNALGVKNVFSTVRSKAIVLLTRENQFIVGLRDRVRIASRAGAKIFVSIHTNAAASPAAHGTEVLAVRAHDIVE